LVVATVLLCIDVLLMGSFLFSYLFCPIWFVATAVKNLIWNPGWKLFLIRIAFPVLTLGIVFANNAIQWKIGEANMARIITACEDFHAANGRYPETLNELVPRQLRSIPRARYSLCEFGFMYFNLPQTSFGPMLVWYKIPPFGRKIYHFEDKRWGYLD